MKKEIKTFHLFKMQCFLLCTFSRNGVLSTQIYAKGCTLGFLKQLLCHGSKCVQQSAFFTLVSLAKLMYLADEGQIGWYNLWTLSCYPNWVNALRTFRCQTRQGHHWGFIGLVRGASKDLMAQNLLVEFCSEFQTSMNSHAYWHAPVRISGSRHLYAWTSGSSYPGDDWLGCVIVALW